MSWLKRMFGGKSETPRGAPSLLRLRSRVLGTPLAIQREKLDVILSVLSDRIGAPELQLHPEAVDAAAGKPSGMTSVPPSVAGPTVAVVPVHGTLVQRGMGLEWDGFSGLTSYGTLRAQIDAALADPTVAEIVLDIDSPGGEVAGLFDLVDHIAAAREQKPITAVVNELAASAAYAIASACTRIVAPRTAVIGSIGVISTHVDQSSFDEKVGIVVTHVTAGAHKADGTPHAPLADDALASMQTRVDALYDVFVATVAKNRGIDEQAVRDTEAQVYLSADALALGLIDEVAPVDAAVHAVAERVANPGEESAAEDDEPEDVPSRKPEDEDEPQAAAPVDHTAALAAAVESARAHAAETLAICRGFGASAELARRLVARGATLDEVRKLASSEAALNEPETNNAVDPYAGGTDPRTLLRAAARGLNERTKR